ncbi:DUF5703 family protein [Mariniluteicoccus endophyticus]
MSTHLRNRGRPEPEYEVERLRIDHTWSKNAVRRLLTDRAEYGGWELERLRRYRDGSREIWVRRKIIRVRPTLDTSELRR